MTIGSTDLDRNGTMETRQLTPEDAARYFDHRREALEREPLAFLSSPGDDIASSVEAVREQLGRAPESVVFGAFDGGLVGSVGVYRDPKHKAVHRAHIWGMYVTPEYRRRGIGRALLLAAVDHARSQPGVLQAHLGVTDAAPEARRLYEIFGFRRWGTEPRYLRHGDRFVDSHHLVLTFEEEPGDAD